MFRYVLHSLGFLRPAFLAVLGLSFLTATSGYAQAPAGSPASALPETGPGPAPAPAPAAAGEASTERVIVTGSYIPTAEEVTASPLDTLTSQEINRSGSQDVLTVLQKRNPDFVGAGNIGQTNANISGNATLGGAVIQIRGFPTLVLYKGRRIADSAAIATGGAQFADVSLFPAALLSRIEVLKDGASALYGSEAIGGVVNIFTKDDYQGAEFGLRYGFTVDPAVAERRAYVIAGTGNETTQVTAGFQYYEEDALYLRERAYSRFPLGGVTTTYSGVGRDQRGGAGQFYLLLGVDPSHPFATAGLNSPFDAPGVTRGVVPPPPPAGANPGQFAQLPQAYRNSSQAEVTSYDLSLIPTSTLDQARTTALASFNHQIFGKQLEFFGDFVFSRNHNQGALNAQPLSNGTGVVILGTTRVDPITGTLVAENRGPSAVFTPFQLSLDTNTLAGRFRLIAGQRYTDHPRTTTTDSTFYRWLVGLRSNFAKDWTAEAAAYYSHYTINYVNGGLVSATTLNALIAAQDEMGNAIPGTTLDFFARNPVGTGPGQITRENFESIFGKNLRNLNSYQEVFDAKVTGFPFTLPGGPVGIALGGEYREEGFKVEDSPEIFIGSVPIKEINAGRGIYSYYGEVSVPVIGREQKVPGVYSLELNAAFRYDHYEKVQEDAKVPKFTLRYQPFKDLTLRATYSNSFVAPTLYNLFGPTNQGFSPTITLNGVTQDQAQVRGGSNPDLVPSKAETYTAGLVYSPTFLQGLTVTADYFRTWQKDIVGTLGSIKIVNSVEASGPASPFIDLIAFGNFPGQPGARPITAPGQLFGNLGAAFVVDNLLNLGISRAEGFDLSARYNMDLQRFGQLEVGVQAVVFTKYDFKTTPFDNYFNVLGLVFDEFGGPTGGGANPDYRMSFLAEYRIAGATLSLSAYYIPEMLNAVGADPENDIQSTYPTVEDYITVDGRLSYTFKGKTTAAAVASDAKEGKAMVDAKSSAAVAGAAQMSPIQKLLDGTTIAVGCNNILDEEPRLVQGSNSVTNLSIYDPFQRFVYFEISKKF